MSRIATCLGALKAAGEGALVCFVTAGDPELETSRRIVLGLADGGADIIELGIPFSDPLADGPSIQASSQRALDSGVNIRSVLDLVSSIRRESDVPLVLMTYYNPVHKYGVERFAGDAADAGADGVIVTDLTPEEADGWKKAADRAGLSTILLLAPTSTDARIEKVARLASGFIYCVSRTGVTGARRELAAGLRELVDRIRARTGLPILVGFGVSAPEHVREICSYADGAVVGSALVNLIAARAGSADLQQEIRSLVSTLKSGTRLQQ